MISLQQVSKVYSVKKQASVPALRDVDFNITRGEYVVITGRSGSGKTTLLNLAAGLARPTTGKVMVNQVDLWSLSDAEQASLRNRKIGFVFQFPSLLPSLTVLENVILPATFGEPVKMEAVRTRALQLLDQVDLADKLSAYPRQLSAGQQQRVVVARSLINEPELLLADEPTSNLDETSEGEILRFFQEMHARNEITILLVTHAGQLVTHGTRMVQLAGGSIVQDQKVQQAVLQP